MSEPVKVLIADKMDPRAAAIFRERGIAVDEKPGLTPDELKNIIVDDKIPKQGRRNLNLTALRKIKPASLSAPQKIFPA